MSIRARITLLGLAVVAVLLTCFSSGVFVLVSSGVPQSQDKQLTGRATAAVTALAAAPPAAFVAAEPPAPVSPADSDDIFTIVYDQSLAVLSRSGPRTAPLLPTTLVPRGGATATGTVVWDGVSVRVAVRAWQRSDLGRAGYLAAAQAVHRQQNDRRGLFAFLLVSGIVAVLVAALGIWVVVRRALRPLKELTAMADEIGRWPGLERRLPVTGRLDDVGRLAISFNGMLDRLAHERRRTADALVAQQRFTADASHELRTPLTTIRSNAGFLRAHPEAAERDRLAAVSDIESESDRMSRLVGELLTLARADAGLSLVFGSHDLSEIAAQVVRQARISHPDRTLHLAADPVAVWVDRDAIVQLLWILIDNASRYANENLWVRVEASAGAARLSVADDGSGIAPQALTAIFGRFYRSSGGPAPTAPPDRDSFPGKGSGAGLGLAIAHSIVSAHHGTITAANNARGGAIFTVELPRPAGPPSHVLGLERP